MTNDIKKPKKKKKKKIKYSHSETTNEGMRDKQCQDKTVQLQTINEETDIQTKKNYTIGTALEWAAELLLRA